jgi:hypothetical protein
MTPSTRAFRQKLESPSLVPSNEFGGGAFFPQSTLNGNTAVAWIQNS